MVARSSRCNLRQVIIKDDPRLEEVEMLMPQVLRVRRRQNLLEIKRDEKEDDVELTELTAAIVKVLENNYS